MDEIIKELRSELNRRKNICELSLKINFFNTCGK